MFRFIALALLVMTTFEASAQGTGFYTATYVEVGPVLAKVGAAALKNYRDESRRHAGNVAFDVWQQTNRPNHFTVVEAWANRGAFDLHQMQKETRDFRNKLATMTGALYDERLYKVLK